MGSAPTQTLHRSAAASNGTGGRVGGSGVGLMGERGRAVGLGGVGRSAATVIVPMSQKGRAKGELPNEDTRTAPTSSSSSDAGFEDEVVLVPTSSFSSNRQHTIPLTGPAAFRPFSPPTSSQEAEGDGAANKPVEGVFATHRRWTSGGKDRDRAGLSEKARGKLPALAVDKVATTDRRRKSLDAVARGGSVFEGVEIEVPARRKSRLHMRWTSGDSEADITLERFAASSSGSATSPKADGGRLSPPVIEDSASPPTRRSSSSGEILVVSKHRSTTAAKPHEDSTSPEPAKQLPSPSPSTSLPEKRRSASVASTASSSRTKHSFELIIDQSSRPRAPPKLSRKPLSFPDKPASHPLNLLRIRSHPPDPAPPPPLPVRFVRNPHFAPAQQLGWIEGKGPHVEVKKRMGPVDRAVAAATTVTREQSPLVSAEGTPGSGRGRRSTRVPVQARPPSMIYPSAIDRLASSAKPSRSPSSQLPTPPPSTSIPLPRRPPLSTVLRRRYDWLHPRSRGPFRIDGLALGTDPTLLGYEWDEDELDEERWAGGEWDEDEDGDGEIKTGRYGGPFRVAQAAEAARRALFSPPNSSSSNVSSSPVKVALDVKPWQVVPWAWKDLDAAKGRAGPCGTAGWATRDPWMHYLFDSSASDAAASSSVVEALSSPVAHQSPRRVLAVAVSGSSSSSPPVQVGAKITAVPPSTSSPAAARTVRSIPSEEDAVNISPVRHEAAQPAGTLTSPIIIDSTTASSASTSRDPSPVVVAMSNRRQRVVRTDSSPDPLDQLSGSSVHSAGASSSRQQSAASPITTSSSSGSASSSSRGIQPIAGPSNPRKRLISPPLPSTTASSTSSSASTSAASASPSSVSPPAKPVAVPSKPRTRPASRRVVSATTSTASTSASASTSSVSPPAKKAPSAPPPPAAKKRKVEDRLAAKPKKPPTPPLVPKQPNLKRPSSLPEGSAAALKRRKKEPTPEGFVRCAHPGCPSPFYQSKAASSAGNHAQNYHGSSTTISWRNPDRSAQLARSKKTSAFECEYCGFWSMNAASTKQHTYVRKGRVCPGPPHGAR
ncbi:hypothetical protein RTBOTA2_002350 [Rhodotorula toruloides]|nr:hypothetical protein RTBOTA2_002350 [Rhodotorula toruloides]